MTVKQSAENAIFSYPKDTANNPSMQGTANLFKNVRHTRATVSLLVADTGLSYTAGAADFVAEGDVIQAAGFLYAVAASGATDEHLETAGGVKLYVSGNSVSVDAFGADPLGVADSTDAFNTCMQWCVSEGVKGRSSGSYEITGTISPGGTYAWDWGVTVLTFDDSDPTVYTEIQETVNGSSVYSGAGVYVCFDTSGCSSSANAGSLSITGTATGGTMKMSVRDTIPATLVAITGATSSSADMTWERLIVQGFGYMFYQGDMRGTAATILPYTRWNIQQLLCRYVLNPMQSGNSGNCFDDIWIDNMRMVRNAGTALIRGTDFNVGSFFTIGLASEDEEDETISLTAASGSATLSADNAFIEVGSIIGSTSGGLNKAGGSIGYVGKVTAKAGTSLTIDPAPEDTDGAAPFVIDPPSITLSQGNLNCVHMYLEQRWDHGIDVGVNSTVRAQQAKFSGGDMCYRYAAPVVITGHESCAVEFGLHNKAINNDDVRRIVAVGSQRDGATYSDAYVNVGCAAEIGVGDVDSDPIEVVSLWDDDVYDFGGVTYTDASGELNQNLSLQTQFSNALAQHSGYLGRVDSYTTGPSGSMVLERIADISTASKTGNFGAVSSDESVKTPGASGTLYHTFTPTEGAVYRCAISLGTFTAGSPQLRWQNDTSLVEAGNTLAREGGRFVYFFKAPAGTINRLALFGFSAGDYTVTEFTVDRVT
ncbi:MAG: hypothetical protein Unbinned7865contig1001_54 [Prokaryotic dsDNA virus sp.]|nr:MAG: hypothetical protein Unbinned7865contig1001_54 [Prokaryotic dsDNA virus sp.]|tara:strand:- start:893 stop:3016 length:2124 start_codon:yes stop_codon:yes gene_type:complete